MQKMALIDLPFLVMRRTRAIVAFVLFLLGSRLNSSGHEGYARKRARPAKAR